MFGYCFPYLVCVFIVHRWTQNKIVFRHPQDTNAKGKKPEIIFNTKKEWVSTRISCTQKINHLKTLFNNNCLSNLKQTNSNKNETSHAIKKQLNPSLRCFGHDFWDFYKYMFIFKFNYLAYRYIANHRELFEIKTPNWLETIFLFYESWWSFALILDTSCWYQLIDFDSHHCQNKKIYTFDQCLQKKMIKDSKKNMKWNHDEDCKLSAWINTYGRCEQLSNSVLFRLYSDKYFSKFNHVKLKHKLIQFWRIK